MINLLNTIKRQIPLEFRDRHRQLWRNILCLTAIFISIILTRVFLGGRKYKILKEDIKLNLGCGPVNLPGFVNVDIYPYKHVHAIRPVDNLKNLDNNSVSLIYASHVLEHFPIERIPRVLREWHRVLASGGILRISVPDFDKLLKIYVAAGNDSHIIERPLMGGQSNIFDYHKSLFNRRSLSCLLENAGFKIIKEWYLENFPELLNHQDSSMLEIAIGNQSYSISLNIEAVKA